MRVDMGIVGVPGVTVSMYADEDHVQELMADFDEKFIQHTLSPSEYKKPRPVARVVFDESRRRLAEQGAVETRYFMI